jgi:hypothetical protein
MKRHLEWSDIRQLGRSDNAGRWYPRQDIAEYFGSIRSPSRAWPWSYAKAAQTLKFARWLRERHPDVARSVGLES